jgi:hypothetical protein
MGMEGIAVGGAKGGMNPFPVILWMLRDTDLRYGIVLQNQLIDVVRRPY